MIETKRSPVYEPRHSAQVRRLSVAMMLAPLSLLGEFLIKETHHRPLGAATFASVALVAWVISLTLSHRVYDGALANKGARAPQIVWGTCLFASVAVLLRAMI